MPTKYYVKNGPLEKIVIADSAMDAIERTLLKQGYYESVDIAEVDLPWPYFTVDTFGFKELGGSLVATGEDATTNYLQFALHMIPTEQALDYFDSRLDSADDYFGELGNNNDTGFQESNDF